MGIHERLPCLVSKIVPARAACRRKGLDLSEKASLIGSAKGATQANKIIICVFMNPIVESLENFTFNFTYYP